MCLTNCNLIIQKFNNALYTQILTPTKHYIRCDIQSGLARRRSCGEGKVAVEVSPVYTLIRDTCPPAMLLQLPGSAGTGRDNRGETWVPDLGVST